MLNGEREGEEEGDNEDDDILDSLSQDILLNMPLERVSQGITTSWQDVPAETDMRNR